MLSPYGRMTPFQQMQMYRIHDPFVFNLVSNGNFDDCQAAVKLINADFDFKNKYAVGAMNSINWARIVAQVVYYIYAYTRVMDVESEGMYTAVPSGNFGNALAAYVAGKMGLRMNIIVATNENDVLAEFFKTGVYRVRTGNEVKATLSPSMDIASASNFERFMFDQIGCNSVLLKTLWSQIGTEKKFEFPVTSGISAGTATDKEVLTTIRLVYDRYGIVVDPHTAVALKVGFDLYGGQDFGPLVFVETAQPAKFEDAIFKAIGLRMDVPPALKHLQNRSDKITRIEEADPAAIADAVKTFIRASVS